MRPQDCFLSLRQLETKTLVSRTTSLNNCYALVLFELHQCIDDSTYIVQQYTVSAGYKAWRCPEAGSCFIRTLVYVFNNYSDKLHLIDMLMKVCVLAVLCGWSTSGESSDLC